MAGQQKQEEALLQNMKDAGCPPEMIASFIECQEEKSAEQLRILSKQRRFLLDCVHENQHKLECLDYLIYSIRKKEKENG